MLSIECPLCGKKCPNELATKEHKKLCNYSPQENENKVIEIIKNEKNAPDTVKIANPYGKGFPLLQDDDNSHDVTIVSRDGSLVTCHAALLAASSSFLEDLLEEPSRKDNSAIIVAQNIDGAQMKNLIDFLYMGKMSVSKEEVNNMKALLKEFQIKVITKNILENADMYNTEDIIVINEDIKVVNEDIKVVNEDIKVINEDDAVNENAYVPTKKKSRKVKQTKGKTKKKIVCDYCDYKSTSIQYTMNHVQKVHPDFFDAFAKKKTKNACDYCDFKNMSLKCMMNHVQKVHPDFFDVKIYMQTPCQNCDQKFVDKKNLYRHKRECHPETLRSWFRLSNNINDGLPYEAKRQCPQCPIVLYNIGRYKDHIQKHLTGKNLPFECENCDKKFSKSYTFRVHRKKHEISLNPFLCNLCGSTFQTLFDYDNHNRDHALEIPQKKKIIQPKPVDTNFSAICSVCGKDFTKKNSYNFHIRNAHVEGDKLLKCPHCPKTFSSPPSHEHHIKLHFPPTLACKHCAKKFHTLHYLKRHIRSQHVDDSQRNFVCSQCGKGFHDKDNYDGHLNMHAGLKPFKCRYCEMCYQNSSNRIAHEKSRHPETYIRRADKFSRFHV